MVWSPSLSWLDCISEASGKTTTSSAVSVLLKYQSTSFFLIRFNILRNVKELIVLFNANYDMFILVLKRCPL